MFNITFKGWAAVSLVILGGLYLTFHSSAQNKPAKADRMTHIAWVEKSLKEMQSVKVGMKRRDLEKVFSTEGGLSTVTHRRFVYRECPYFKVNVEFTLAEPHKEGNWDGSKEDKIVKISEPFLEWSIMD